MTRVAVSVYFDVNTYTLKLSCILVSDRRGNFQKKMEIYKTSKFSNYIASILSGLHMLKVAMITNIGMVE